MPALVLVYEGVVETERREEGAHGGHEVLQLGLVRDAAGLVSDYLNISFVWNNASETGSRNAGIVEKVAAL